MVGNPKDRFSHNEAQFLSLAQHQRDYRKFVNFMNVEVRMQNRLLVVVVVVVVIVVIAAVAAAAAAALTLGSSFIIMWFLFGEVSSSSGCFGWAALFYCGTPFHIIIFMFTCGHQKLCVLLMPTTHKDIAF